MKNILRMRIRALGGLAAVVVAGVVIAACGSSSNTGTTTTTGSSSSTSTGSTSTATKSAKPLKLAFMSFAVQNSYDAPMLAAAKSAAAAGNATITVFDANNDPNKQYSEMQDVITQGGYNGIITQPIESTNLIPLVKQAVAKGIRVVNVDQILGPNLSTSAIQVPGQSGNVTFVPTEMGMDLGKLTVQACASKKLNPCNVGYLYDIKASALDVAIHQGFQEATKGTPVKVVAVGQDFFTPAQGLTAVQNMLASDPSINAIAGSDQGIEGAETATKGKPIVLVGYGGSQAGIAGVKSGVWYGTIAQDPATEGKVGVETLIKAINNKTDYPGVNPLDALPDGGVITKSNVDKFTGEWPG
jgi:ribose transport system substrate-binding protein